MEKIHRYISYKRKGLPLGAFCDKVGRMVKELGLEWWEGVCSVKAGRYGMSCLIYEKMYNLH